MAAHYSGKVAQKVIIEKDGKILLCRNSFDKNLGVWDLPGGRLEAAEDPLQGAAREVLEELGIIVDIKRVVYVEQFMHTRSGEMHLLLAYHAVPRDPYQEIVMDPNEVEEYIWIDRTQLYNQRIFDNCLRAVERFFSAE